MRSVRKHPFTMLLCSVRHPTDLSQGLAEKQSKNDFVEEVLGRGLIKDDPVHCQKEQTEVRQKF